MPVGWDCARCNPRGLCRTESMKIFFAVCILGLILMAASYGTRDGNEVKLYVKGQDIRPVVTYLNGLLRPAALTLRIVDVESDADVSVEFRDNIGAPDAVGTANAALGQIYLLNSIPGDHIYTVLLHELLHCAGLGHEPDDQSSVLYTHSRRQGQLKKRHQRELRRLAGITAPERIIAHVRMMCGL